MAKKNAEKLNYFKELTKLRKRIDRDATEFYASAVLALTRRGIPVEEVQDIIVDIGVLWFEAYDNDTNLAELCLNETGIDIRQDVTRRPEDIE